MDKKLVEQENMRQILMEQMKGKTKAQQQQKHIERELEKINLENVTKVIEDHKTQEKQKIKDQK